MEKLTNGALIIPIPADIDIFKTSFINKKHLDFQKICIEWC